MQLRLACSRKGESEQVVLRMPVGSDNVDKIVLMIHPLLEIPRHVLVAVVGDRKGCVSEK